MHPSDSIRQEPRSKGLLARTGDVFTPRTLRARLTLPFIVVTTIVLIILYVVIGTGAERIYINRLSEELEYEASLAAYTIGEARAAGASADRIASRVDDLGDLVDRRITLIDENGTVLVDTHSDASGMENHNGRPEVVEAREQGSGNARRGSASVDESYLYVAVTMPQDEGTILRISVPLDDVNDTVETAQSYILIAVGAVIVLTSVAAWLISGRLSKPLEDLRTHANSVANGDFSARVEPSDTLEIGVVGDAFNLMTEELERSLKEEDQTKVRLGAVMEGLADGVVLTDDAGIVLRMNEAAETMLLIEEADALGCPFVQVSRDHELALVVRKALDGKNSPQATVEYGLARRTIMVTARIIEGSGERLGLAVLRDVSDLRRLEMVRREFVANVSHELRTPLASIRALVETLEAGAVEEVELAQEFFGRIVGEVDRLNALVEDLLNFGRLEAGRAPLQLEKADPGEAVRAGADRLRPQIGRAGLSLEIEVEEGLPEIELDIKRLEQVLLNLVHNAIKFTPPDGTIAISVGRQRGNIVVQVQDTGVGIAEDELSRLFERFYKSDKARRSEGTGLGLAIAKHIVQLHGGEMSVESELGQGSTFTFTIPISRKKAKKRARRHALGLV